MTQDLNALAMELTNKVQDIIFTAHRAGLIFNVDAGRFDTKDQVIKNLAENDAKYQSAANYQRFLAEQAK